MINHISKFFLLFIFIIIFLSFKNQIKILENDLKLIKKNKKSQNTEKWGFEVLTKKPLTASKTEVIENNRARSAKLRVGRFIN